MGSASEQPHVLTSHRELQPPRRRLAPGRQQRSPCSRLETRAPPRGATCALGSPVGPVAADLAGVCSPRSSFTQERGGCRLRAALMGFGVGITYFFTVQSCQLFPCATVVELFYLSLLLHVSSPEIVFPFNLAFFFFRFVSHSSKCFD